MHLGKPDDSLTAVRSRSSYSKTAGQIQANNSQSSLCNEFKGVESTLILQSPSTYRLCDDDDEEEEEEEEVDMYDVTSADNSHQGMLGCDYDTLIH